MWWLALIPVVVFGGLGFVISLGKANDTIHAARRQFGPDREGHADE
jgi:hypothetical protein